MARPRRDGTPARAVSRRKLTDVFVSSRKAQERPELIWDAKQPCLALSVRPTGKKAWKVVYRFHGRPRWLHLGDARAIGLADARRLAARVMLDVAEGKDPAAERRAERLTGTFADLASQYVELHAKKHNKSWRQAERLVHRHLLPRWGRLKPSAITRADVRAVMIRIEAPIVANQTLAAASAIFAWAIRQEILAVNPCKLVDRNPTKDRERVLSDAEVKLLWEKLDPGLRLILLTGQRPGEISAMQREHIADGWWQMPGKPQGSWPGTKNARDHRVWLSETAQDLIESHLAERGYKSRALLKGLVAGLGIERVTPHDLRRTCLTWITRLGFGRDAMDRVANHRTSTVTDVYDRHGYADEDKRIMAAVARHVIGLVEGAETSNVVSFR
jgi:integrase